MEDFAKPENYQGNDLLTIKNLAEKIQLEKRKETILGDFRKKENVKEKSYSILNKSFYKLQKDLSRQPMPATVRDQKLKLSDYRNLIKRSSLKKNMKRESLLIDLDLLKLNDLSVVTEPVQNVKKSVPTSKIIFGLVYNKKTESEIKGIAIRRFKWAGRMILIWMNYFNLVTAKSQHKKKEYFVLVKYKENEGTDKMKSQNFQFDKHHYIARKEIELTSDMQKTLTIHPKQRTEEQLNAVMYGIGALDAFNEYPLHLKKKLCKVAYYKRVDPHRFIIRQGHRAEYFYFIISGTAIVTITDNDKGIERTVNSLVKGCSFGELALLHHSKRTASVVSTSLMQLLAIERSDFFHIFMHMKSDLSKYPEHVAFLKEISIFNHLDADKIVRYSEACLCHFYKQGSVICSSDILSDWVYVVKSGDCTVVKEIKIPINEKPITIGTLCLDDVNSKMQCYDNYYFIPTPLDEAVGNLKSKTRYLWRSPTVLKPGDYFFLKNEIMEDSKSKDKSEQLKENERNTFSIFVDLAHLTSKDFYGLSSVVFSEEDKLRIGDMASVSLISNRAEMVLISKKYLSQNSCEEFIKDIRQGICQYPSDEVFLETYKTRVNWDKFKLKNYKTAIRNVNK